MLYKPNTNIIFQLRNTNTNIARLTQSMPTLRSGFFPYPPGIEVNNTETYNSPLALYHLIERLNECTTSLKKDAGICDYAVSLRHDESEESTPTLLPRWTAFIDTIRLNNPDNQCWKFQEVSLPAEMMKSLQHLLVSRNIQRLELVKMTYGSTANQDAIYNFICDVLEQNTTIKCLVLKQSTSFGKELYEAIENHPSLEELHLLEMNIEDHPPVLRSILRASKDMRYVNLHNCALGTEGSEIISNFLKENHKLENLYLGNTGMTNTDAVQISEALQTNNKLRVLSVGGKGNNITAVGRKALTKALFDTSSLDAVANSNNTCMVSNTVSNNLPPSSDPCPHEALLDILNCNSCPKDNRRWKVLSVLYATNGMGIGDEFKTYQNLKVIPELLAFITASFEDEELPDDEQGDVQDKEDSGASPAASSIFPSLSSLFSSSSSKKDADDDSGDEISVESDESFDSYDSELDELDDAFEEEEDEVYENFDKSFLDPTFCGERARLTIMFQVVQKWGLPLLDKNPSQAEEPVVAAAAEDGKQKKRRTTSWKCDPFPGTKGKKSRKSTKRGFREAVISQKEIESLAN